MMNMGNLYKEYETEREKLSRLVINAIGNNQPVASNDEIIKQSHIVDSIIEKLANLKLHNQK